MGGRCLPNSFQSRRSGSDLLRSRCWPVKSVCATTFGLMLFWRLGFFERLDGGRLRRCRFHWMSEVADNQLPGAPDGKGFVTTQWAHVREAADSEAPHFEAALEQLCRDYWYPLYAFVRRSGNGPEEARDLTQSFFEHLLSKRVFKQASPELGRFRSFLLGALKNHLRKRHRDANRLKRGGGMVFSPLEWDEAEGRYSMEPADEVTPELLFDRNWARSMVRQVVERLRTEYEEAGEAERFEKLRFTLEDPRAVPYAEIAGELGLTEAGVKSAVHRLRRRFRELAREVVAEQVDDLRDVDAEIRLLIEALG